MTNQSKQKNSVERKKYWYEKTVYYCPVCGREDVYRERVYTPKPKNWGDRNTFIEKFDYCNV